MSAIRSRSHTVRTHRTQTRAKQQHDQNVCQPARRRTMLQWTLLHARPGRGAAEFDPRSTLPRGHRDGAGQRRGDDSRTDTEEENFRFELHASQERFHSDTVYLVDSATACTGLPSRTQWRNQ